MDNPHLLDNTFLGVYPDHSKEHPHILKHQSLTLPTLCMHRKIGAQMSTQKGSFAIQNLYGFDRPNDHVWVVRYVCDSY
jgi:hypothetical protein